jgi:hypothetical protein
LEAKSFCSSFGASLKVPRWAETNSFAFGLQLLAFESWRLNVKEFASASLQLLSSKLKSFKRGQNKFSCLNKILMESKKLQMEMKKLERIIGKTWKHTSSCCVCVSSTS